MDILPAVRPPPPPARMTFSGKEHDLFKILLRGSLLQIPTFGFYRFWLTTDVRRHLWTNTRIGEDFFEYTGRAKELLIGFLIAMAVLLPIYGVYFLLTLEAERLMAFSSIPLGGLLYVLGYYALYRARRYRATRTIFRGVRFWMSGSGFAYVGRVVLWDLLTLVTLGFAYAWRSAALERYKMGHTRYGDLQGAFVGSGLALFKRGAWIWAIFLALAAIVAFFAFRKDVVSALVIGVPLAVAAPFLFPIFQAMELRWWVEGIRLGPVTVTSDLGLGAVLKCYLKTLLFWMLYSGGGGVMIGLVFTIVLGIVRLVVGPVESVPAAVGVPGAVLGGLVGGILYIAFLLGFGIIRRIFLDRGIWAAVVNSVTLTNLEALDLVVATGGEVPSGVGEGLLDALDFGGGV